MNMTGRIQRYQVINSGDFAKVRTKKFIDKKIVYLTDALAIGLIQIYFTDGNENLLDVSILNTKILDANLIFNLQASSDWTAEYDVDSGVYRIVFLTEKSGIIVYVAQFEDVN